MTTSEQELLQISDDLMKLRAKAAEIRRTIPPTEVQDYSFTGSAGEKVKLSEMFGSGSELILIHNMGRTCRYCTLWADGLNGFTKHLESRAAFVVTTRLDDIPAVAAFRRPGV